MSLHPSAPPSITSHLSQSCLSCPSMHCSSSPHRPADVTSLTGGRSSDSDLQNFSSFLHPPVGPFSSSSPSFLSAPLSTSCHPSNSSSSPQRSLPCRPPPPSNLPTQSSRGVGFSLAEVQQELQLLQKQLRNESAWLRLCMNVLTS